MTAAKIPCRHGLWLVARVIQIGPRNQLLICNAKKPPSYIFCKKTDMNRVTTSFRLFLTKETSPSTFLYSAAITGGSCRSLTFRLGAPLRSHLPFTLSHPSQLSGILCNDSRACTLFVTVFSFLTIGYGSICAWFCKGSAGKILSVYLKKWKGGNYQGTMTYYPFYRPRYFFTSAADRFSTSSSGKSSLVSSSLAISNSPISRSKCASLSITIGT